MLRDSQQKSVAKKQQHFNARGPSAVIYQRFEISAVPTPSFTAERTYTYISDDTEGALHTKT